MATVHPASRTESDLPDNRNKSGLAFGWTKIILGSTCIVLQTIVIGVKSGNHHAAGVGIWAGAAFIMDGTISIAAALKLTRKLIISSLVTSILSICAFVSLILLFTIREIVTGDEFPTVALVMYSIISSIAVIQAITDVLFIVVFWKLLLKLTPAEKPGHLEIAYPTGPYLTPSNSHPDMTRLSVPYPNARSADGETTGVLRVPYPNSEATQSAPPVAKLLISYTQRDGVKRAELVVPYPIDLPANPNINTRTETGEPEPTMAQFRSGAEQN